MILKMKFRCLSLKVYIEYFSFSNFILSIKYMFFFSKGLNFYSSALSGMPALTSPVSQSDTLIASRASKK